MNLDLNLNIRITEAFFYITMTLLILLIGYLFGKQIPVTQIIVGA